MSELIERLISGPAVQDPAPIVRLCKDCDYFKYDPLAEGRYSTCARERYRSNVTGEFVTPAVKKYCEVERKEYETFDTCGPRGRYWKLRPAPPPRPRQWWKFWQRS